VGTFARKALNVLARFICASRTYPRSRDAVAFLSPSLKVKKNSRDEMGTNSNFKKSPNNSVVESSLSTHESSAYALLSNRAYDAGDDCLQDLQKTSHNYVVEYQPRDDTNGRPAEPQSE